MVLNKATLLMMAGGGTSGEEGIFTLTPDEANPFVNPTDTLYGYDIMCGSFEGKSTTIQGTNQQTFEAPPYSIWYYKNAKYFGITPASPHKPNTSSTTVYCHVKLPSGIIHSMHFSWRTGTVPYEVQDSTNPLDLSRYVGVPLRMYLGDSPSPPSYL